MYVAEIRARKVMVKVSRSVVTNHLKEMATDSYNNKQFKKAVSYADRVLKALPHSMDFKLFKAECFMYLNKMEKIQEIEDVSDCTESDRYYLNSLHSFHEGHLDDTLSILCQALALDPSHQRSKAMLTKVEKLLAHRVNDDRSSMEKQYRDVIQACTDVMEAPKIPFTLRSELLYNRAVAQSNVGFVSEAISDCNHVLEERNNDVRVLLLRAEIQERREEYKKSIEDYTMALTIESIKSNVVQYARIQSKVDQLKNALKYQDAQQYMNTGDHHYNQKCYRTALFSYDQAIKLWPENVSFLKQRIACFMMLADYRRVIQESKSAHLINSNCPEIHEYVTECHLVLGDVNNAANSIQKCTNTGTQQNKVSGYKQQFDILQKSTEKAKDHYRTGDFESARNQSYTSENYREASESLSEALELIPIESALITPSFYYKLAVSLSKIGRVRDAIKRCTEAIKKNWYPLDFLGLRAWCYMSMRNFRMAVEDYQALSANSSDAKTMFDLQVAQSALIRSQSNDHYDILDIPKTASQDDIKLAYKKLALVHHPDKHANAPTDERIEQQELFKKIGNAYEILMDPQKKFAYDQSYANFNFNSNCSCNNNYYYEWNYHN